MGSKDDLDKRSRRRRRFFLASGCSLWSWILLATCMENFVCSILSTEQPGHGQEWYGNRGRTGAQLVFFLWYKSLFVAGVVSLNAHNLALTYSTLLRTTEKRMAWFQCQHPLNCPGNRSLRMSAFNEEGRIAQPIKGIEGSLSRHSYNEQSTNPGGYCIGLTDLATLYRWSTLNDTTCPQVSDTKKNRTSRRREQRIDG